MHTVVVKTMAGEQIEGLVIELCPKEGYIQILVPGPPIVHRVLRLKNLAQAVSKDDRTFINGQWVLGDICLLTEARSEGWDGVS